jgi:hypothetical protein
MSHPDYSAQGWQHILVSLDGPVAIVKLNRAKQYGPHHTVPLFCPLTGSNFLKSGATRLRFQAGMTWSLRMISLTEMIASASSFSLLITPLMPFALE